MVLAQLAAMAMASRGAGVGTIEMDREPDEFRIDVNPFDDAWAAGLIPRAPKGPTPSKYTPHNGSREMERRRKRMAKLTPHTDKERVGE